VRCRDVVINAEFLERDSDIFAGCFAHGARIELYAAGFPHDVFPVAQHHNDWRILLCALNCACVLRAKFRESCMIVHALQHWGNQNSAFPCCGTTATIANLIVIAT
jgi:hypothetical protein